MDKISVITTFYNAEKFIFSAINSVNVQQLPKNVDFEYVIVDDHSPDGSRAIVEDFITKNVKNPSKWKLVKPECNLGCGGARKFGIDNATGNYLMFLDADDYYIHFDFIARAYKKIKSTNADIVEYGVLFNQPNGQITNSVAPKEFVISNNPTAALNALYKDNLIKFNVWTKIYKRSIIDTKEYSTSRTYEDVRTIPYWVANAKKIVIVPEIEINYRAATGSIIREDINKTRMGTITAIAETFESFKNDPVVLKAMYSRAMVDLTAVLDNHSSDDPYFNEMSRLNTYMLKYIYPDEWQNITFNLDGPINSIEDNINKDTFEKIDMNKVQGFDINIDDDEIE